MYGAIVEIILVINCILNFLWSEKGNQEKEERRGKFTCTHVHVTLLPSFSGTCTCTYMYIMYMYIPYFILECTTFLSFFYSISCVSRNYLSSELFNYFCIV